MAGILQALLISSVRKTLLSALNIVRTFLASIAHLLYYDINHRELPSKGFLLVLPQTCRKAAKIHDNRIKRKRLKKYGIFS